MCTGTWFEERRFYFVYILNLYRILNEESKERREGVRREERQREMERERKRKIYPFIFLPLCFP
jgi:hypothetical protein